MCIRDSAGTDHFLITFMMGVSAITAGYIMGDGLLSLREVIALTGIVQIFLGLIWVFVISPKEKELLDQSLQAC